MLSFHNLKIHFIYIYIFYKQISQNNFNEDVMLNHYKLELTADILKNVVILILSISIGSNVR